MGTKRLLIVDDNSETRQMLATLFEKAGYECDTAEDGLDGIKKFDQSQKAGKSFDLVITDAVMPNKTGFELAAHVRSLSEVPVVIMTAHDEPLVKPHADHVKANAVWQKPMDPTQITNEVATLLCG